MNELIQLPHGNDCIAVIKKYVPYSNQKFEKNENGEVEHKQTVESFQAIENVYNEHGARVGKQIVSYDPKVIRAMYEKLIEVEGREPVFMKPQNELPF